MHRQAVPDVFCRLVIVFGLLALLPGFSGCGLPLDPEGTQQRIQLRGLRVGVLSQSPWTSVDDGEVGGVEAELAAELAAELDVAVMWVPGSESTLMTALVENELDLVIGGITSDSPWKDRVGLSQPFYTSQFVVMRRHGEPAGGLKGRQIAVEPGRAEAALIREMGAEPVVMADLVEGDVLLAAESWRLHEPGMSRAGPVIAEHEHVWAVPPGENGWLMRVERFLQRKSATIEGRLQRALPEGP